MYKAIVFDLDGTLIDSPLCFNNIRKDLDIPDGQYILEYLETLPIVTREQKLKKLEDIEVKAARDAILFPGVKELLTEIKIKKIKLGLFTRNCSQVVDIILDKFAFSFDKIITRDQAPPKPNPIGLRMFLEEWKVQKKDFLFVGDFKFDIDCGKAAGVKTALFTNGKTISQTLNPDHIIFNYFDFWSF